MADWLETLPNWALAWAAVRGHEATVDGAGVRTVDELGRVEYIVGWPGGDPDQIADEARSHPGTVLTLVAEDAAAVWEHAASHRLDRVKQAVLLTAPTTELETSSALPENGGLEEAPLEMYDMVEATEFGRPVASGRIRVEEGVAVIGALKTHHPDTGAAFGQAVLAALVEEAYVHGAETLYTIVSERQAPGYSDTGWAIAAHLITLRAKP